MREITVGVGRRFALLSSRKRHGDFLYLVPGKPQRWREIEDKRRVLILAASGASKTLEVPTRAHKIHEDGKKAFIIRIEAIDATFEGAFGVGGIPAICDLCTAARLRK
jgi:hypothetical protein